MIEPEVLKKYSRVVVVGASANPERPSYRVASYLIENGYDVIPVNPGVREILGKVTYPDLSAIPGGVEVVDVFRRPEHVLPISKATVEIGARALWLQDGVINEEAAILAEEAGLLVVMNDCMLRCHRLMQ